jgi:hypothetical protein
MAGDTFYRLFIDAKRALRRDPSLTDDQVAETCGFSPRMLVADERIGATIREARRDLRNVGAIPDTEGSQ